MKYKAFVDDKCRKLFVQSMTFGEWLRDQLNKTGISNAELSRRVGVSPTYIGNLVRDYSPNTKKGKGRPSEEVVKKVAKALQADENEALNAAGYAADNAIVISSLNGEFDPEDIEKIKEYIELIRLKKRSLIN